MDNVSLSIEIMAGADQGLCDLAGWTEKEHAVFRGHLKVGQLLDAHHRQQLRCTSEHQMAASSRLEPSDLTPNHLRMQSDSSQIFITLGPSNTRSKRRPVESVGQSFSTEDQNAVFGVMVKIGSAKSTSAHCIELPISGSTINRPVQ